MSIASSESKSAVDLAYLKDQHEHLRQELSEHSVDVRNKTDTDFFDRVNSFFQRIQQSVPYARTTEEISAINRIAAEWQMIFTTELNIARDVLEELGIGISQTHMIDEPTLPSPLSIDEKREILFERVRERAFLISKNWKVFWLKRLFFDFGRQPERLHQMVLSVPHRTPEDDWHDACTCLASDVLDGRIDLALQLGVAGFEFLDGVWLEDVKRLNAYLDWEHSQPDCALDDPQAHYDLACRGIHERVLDPHIKAGRESFKSVEKWLHEHVLDGDQINLETRPYVRELIERKAERLWERTQCDDADINWNRAEQYVRRFYLNLIPAVLHQDAEAAEAILTTTDVFSLNEKSCEIVSALEAALIIYFIHPELAQSHFDCHESFL